MNKLLTLTLLSSCTIAIIASDFSPEARRTLPADVRAGLIELYGSLDYPIPTDRFYGSPSQAAQQPLISTADAELKQEAAQQQTQIDAKKEAAQANGQAELKKTAAINAEPKGDTNTQILHATLLENQKEILKQLAELTQMVKAQQNKAPQRPARISTNSSDNTFAQMPRH